MLGKTNKMRFDNIVHLTREHHFNITLVCTSYCLAYWLLPSVLWRCWLHGRKGIQPVKTECWVAGMVICLERGADLHMALLMPLPLTVSCFSKIQIGFNFLVPAHLGSPGQQGVIRVYVCIHMCVPCQVERWWQRSTAAVQLQQLQFPPHLTTSPAAAAETYQYKLSRTSRDDTPMVCRPNELSVSPGLYNYLPSNICNNPFTENSQRLKANVRML